MQTDVATEVELETVFNAANSGIIAFDKTGLILRVNNHARHMLGGISDPVPFAWPEPIRFLDAESLHPLETSADPIKRVLSGLKLHKEMHLLQRQVTEQHPRYVRVTSSLVPDSTTGVFAVVVIDDVSDEERNRQVVERKSRLDALGQLTGGIAHDFNNLLTSLLYSIVLARRTADSEERNENLQDAESAINRARLLTTRLLAFARKQPGQASSRTAEKTLQDFHKLVRPMLEANVFINVEVEEPGLIVFCDQAQLESALMNLVLNSRDAMLRAGKGNQIVLKARAVGTLDAYALDTPVDSKTSRFVEISVSDNGPGMNEETLSRAADPFFTTKDTNSGTGLGLAMVYGFARQANGAFRIYSEAGVGTTVQLTLPRGTVENLREEPVAEPEIIRGNGEVILIVEDEFQILSAMSRLLEDIGYNVLMAASGREAMDLVGRGTSFDILLTDIVMPGEVGGFKLAHQLRKLNPNLPVIYMSGYTGFTTTEMGDVQAPMLQKPTPPAELSRALAAQLANGSN